MLERPALMKVPLLSPVRLHFYTSHRHASLGKAILTDALALITATVNPNAGATQAPAAGNGNANQGNGGKNNGNGQAGNGQAGNGQAGKGNGNAGGRRGNGKGNAGNKNRRSRRSRFIGAGPF
jgi:hypothetical protein